MKTLIIGYSPRKIAPYMDQYIRIFENNHVDYTYCTREIKDEWLDSKTDCHRYVVEYEKSRNPFKKVCQLIKWRKKVISLIQLGNYDTIIALTCYPTVILSDYLVKNYANRYIVDIRDYSPLLSIKPIYRRFKKAVENSFSVITSSAGFAEWIPSKQELHILHNMPSHAAIQDNPIDFENVINVGYLGCISYYPQNEAIIKALANNSKFHLTYRGIEIQNGKLKSISDSYAMKNISLYGPFQNSQKAEMYKDIDIVNAVYGNDSLVVTTALPNKLYDAALYRKPIIVSEGTYLSSIVQKYNLGLSLDLTKDILKQIDEYIDTFDETLFNDGSRKFIETCEYENTLTERFILRFTGFEK